ncbi:thiamine pyrophosphate-binding protein [Egibacter rhizosphaerae]|uniref:Thiamine pyrophosphate-binding protein n=1 Tax=Egibacter rhizosphaerae TaxID=1670831 RepID=A0A411YB57_9ACTN|nr:thiamine pyrophosphate-dependent enzyme [Egibacter rhizosphaerae]QBI18426.1 thiamine pyrophosphate-binding protein [Egibacter rhizosphaerae]
MSGVAEAIVEQLVGVGVRRAYTVPGESFLPLLDAFDRHPSTMLVSTRHESGAAFMAEADAKLTGVPAVAMATRGVGASNLSIGVHTARQDSTPMIVLLGQVETAHLTREAFQEVDLPAYYAEITKWAATATSAERLPELVDRAWHAATSGRPGPAMLALPADVLEGDAPEDDGWRPSVARHATAALAGPEAEELAARLSEAAAPVIIAGGGAQGAREQLVAAAEALGAGVYASFRRQDVFPNDHPLYLGHLTLGTPPTILEALREADAVLIAGARMSEITTQAYTLPRPDAWIAQIDADPEMVGAVVPVDLGVVGGAREVLGQLAATAAQQPAPTRDWREAHTAFEEASRPTAHVGDPIHPEAVMAALAATHPDDTLIANDAGNFSVFGHRFWSFRHPRTQLGPTSGAMGYGVPAGVAAALAEPEREVVVLVGDGGLLMTGQELETAVRYGARLTVVVFRNGLYGTIALHQGRQHGRTSGVDIGEVDVAGLAHAYGAAAWRVSRSDELEPALAAARDHAGPAVVDVLVDPDVLTPAARLSDLVAEGGSR